MKEEEQEGGVVRSSRALNLNLVESHNLHRGEVVSTGCRLLSLTLRYVQYIELNGGTSVLYFYCA